MQSASLIDLDALPENVRRRIEMELREGVKRHEREQVWRALLAPDSSASDDEIITNAQAEYPDAPITLANRYKDVSWPQETGLGVRTGSPRRPVFLRGGLNVLIRRYGLSASFNSGGWASNVAARAIRMSKRTILNHDEFLQFRQEITSRVARKFPGASKVDTYIPIYIGDHPRTWRDEKVEVLIQGRFRYLTRSEFHNVKALHAIVRKTDKLDIKVRKALAVQHMHERLAA